MTGSGALVPISVVIPARNRARSLPACLASVLGQDSPPAEVIVVDDGSNDDTVAVAERHAVQGVRVVRLGGGRGAQVARSEGVAQAAHEWIAFQDSDDLWLPGKLRRQQQALREAAFDPFVVVQGEGLRQLGEDGPREPMHLPRTEGRCHAQLLQRPGPMFQALLVSRTALARAGGLDLDCPSYQEWDTAIRLAAHARFVHLDEPLFVWVRHADETISRDARRTVLGFDHVVSAHREAIVAQLGDRTWRRLRYENIARALQAGLWPEAQALLEREPPGLARQLASALARRHWAPRGVGRLLGWASRA